MVHVEGSRNGLPLRGAGFVLRCYLSGTSPSRSTKRAAGSKTAGLMVESSHDMSARKRLVGVGSKRNVAGELELAALGGLRVLRYVENTFDQALCGLRA